MEIVFSDGNSEVLPIKKEGKNYFFWKRAFDGASAIALFILISPLFLFLVIGAKISSKGPAIYKDERVGKNGQVFNMLKFRSMFVDANDHPERYFSPEQMIQWKKERKVDNDPRITKFGRFLRKTSLDEFPQLINIISGKMSVVGPRAITRTEIDSFYTKEQADLLLSCKPGLTGYWQVYGRSNVTYESGERTKMDMIYFQKRSLSFDSKMILLTIPAVLCKRGAK
jgi:lipopolysaccharide/colanic/teichoic acid biosynthesis glycosyltransferase